MQIVQLANQLEPGIGIHGRAKCACQHAWINTVERKNIGVNGMTGVSKLYTRYLTTINKTHLR